MIDDRGETIAHINPNYILSDEQYLIDIVNRILSPLKLGDIFFSGKFQGVKNSIMALEVVSALTTLKINGILCSLKKRQKFLPKPAVF